MPSKQSLKTYLASLKSNWTSIAQGAVFIATALTSVIKPLSIFNPVSGVTKVRGLAIFVVTILTGLFFYLNSKWGRKKDAKRWAIITLVSLVLSIVSFLAFQHLGDTRTCRHDEEIYIIGTELTPQGARYSSTMPGISCQQLLMDFTGKAEDIWTESSISQSRLLLSLSYLVCFSLASVCLLSLLQVIKCLTAGRGR
jgi:hypothetical protein